MQHAFCCVQHVLCYTQIAPIHVTVGWENFADDWIPLIGEVTQGKTKRRTFIIYREDNNVCNSIVC